MIKPIAFALALVLGLAGVLACGGSSSSPTQPTTATITTMPSDADMLAAKTLGSTSAKNTITEYVSFACVTCAQFHLITVPQIISQYVNTGQASLTFVTMFTSAVTDTAVAAELTRCTGTTHFFDAVNTVFTNQPIWLGSDTALQTVMLNFGMSQTLENNCLADSALFDGLVAQTSAALSSSFKLPDGTPVTGLYAIPAVSVNGVILDGFDATGNQNANFQPTLANVAQQIK